MQASMSRRGNCFENAPIESFWGTLKSELVYHHRFAMREQAKRAISEYIELFYAPKEVPFGGQPPTHPGLS
jgi:putative transposase